MSHIKLSLCPALTLIPGLHKGQRLFIINNSIMSPGSLNTMSQRLHGKFHILNQTGSPPAILLQNISGNTHTSTAQYSRQAQIGLSQMGNMVDYPESNGKGACYPGIIRILGIQIALNNLGSLAEMMIHLHEETRVHQIICIKDTHSIVLLVHSKELLKHPLQSIALALLGRMGTLTNNGASLSSYLSCIIGAIICNNIDIIQLLGIFQLFEILYQLANNRLLIMGSHNNRHSFLRGGDFLFLETPQTKKSNKEKIHCK